MKTMSIAGPGAVVLGLALSLVSAAPAAGQEADLRWLPWLGCWEPTAVSDADLVCVRPGDAAGAMEVLRVRGTEVIGRELIHTDGARHEASHETCSGWEEGAFSRDGRRIFLRSSYSCQGGAEQQGGGILALTPSGEWLDVRVAGMGGERGAAWVQRLTPAEPALAEAAGFGDLIVERSWSARSARQAAGAGLDVDDVIEANAQVPEEAVRAFLAEHGSRLELSAAEVVRMADSGVSEDLVDVAVAVSYPDRFRVRAPGQEVAPSALDDGSLRRRWASRGWANVAFYDPFYAPWSLRYGYYGYGYGYSPYSYGYGYSGLYGYGWGYGGYYGYTPVVVDVDRVQPEHGRVIAGRGYSRGGSGSTASPGGSAGGSASGPAGVSGGGYSSGGSASSGGGGRTAQPRGGGGGGGR